MEATTPKRVKIETIKPNEKNPRFIRDEKYKKLLASISAFPDMLLARPIIVDEYGVILGGNMRWRAAKELGHTHVNVVVVKGWTEEQKKEFIIKDNLNYGDWDFDILANEFDVDFLSDWGIEVENKIEDITDEIPSDLIKDNVNKPISIKITFNSIDDYKKIEKSLDDFFSEKSIDVLISVSGGEL